MTHNGVKMAQTQADPISISYFTASGCEEYIWQAVAYNGSKRRAAKSGRVVTEQRRPLTFGELLTQAAGGLLTLAGGSGVGTCVAEPNRPDQEYMTKEPE